jgi:hypothetical protein
VTRQTLCAHCEDRNNPVTPENGFNFRYRVTQADEIEMLLHDECAEKWASGFGVENPSASRC